ncbi:hypothetical protein L3Q82_014594, partial [Scortum barcoo]
CWTGGVGWAAGMVPDMERIIESIIQGDQDTVQVLLHTYNTQYADCFFFNTEEQERKKFRKNKVRDYAPDSDSEVDSDNDEPDLLLRQRLAAALLCFISGQLQPAVLRVCLYTLRILSRDRRALGPMVTDSALFTLAHLGGISSLQACPQQEEETTADAAPSAGGSVLSTPVEVAGAATINGSVYHCYEWRGDGGHVLLARGKKDTREENKRGEREGGGWGGVLQHSLWENLKQGIWSSLPSTGQFYKLRLLFLLTALRPELRLQLQQSHISVLYILLSAHWFTCPCQERGVSVLTKGLEQCLAVRWGEGYEVLSDSTAPPISKEMSQDVIEILKILFNIAHRFHRQEPDEGQKLKEKLTPVLNLLTESSRVHRETRQYLRHKILPPLRDVAIRPEQDTTLRGQLVRLMTHVDTDVKHCAAELLFVLCKENVSRFVKYTGYGNAAGLLAARGLLTGRRNSGDGQYNSQYSSDSDSDTEEYREARSRINLVTGRVEAEQPDPMEGMTEEEKEQEARRLISMINRLSQDQIIQPLGVTREGRLAPLWGQMWGCTLEEEEDSEEDSDLMPEVE